MDTKPLQQDRDSTISARGVTKVYRTGDVTVNALDGVDFDLFRGEIVVLLGPSGSGKSTLLNIIGGLDAPSAGQVFFNGSELTRFDDRALTEYRRHHVGFVFQFYNLIPSLTARENVSLVTEIARNPMAPEDALALVGLKDRIDHFPSQLSGGEQQRVAIARALANAPKVVLADEPTGNLDHATAITVTERLLQLSHGAGVGMLVATHNPELAALMDRRLTLSAGRLVAA